MDKEQLIRFIESKFSGKVTQENIRKMVKEINDSPDMETAVKIALSKVDSNDRLELSTLVKESYSNMRVPDVIRDLKDANSKRPQRPTDTYSLLDKPNRETFEPTSSEVEKLEEVEKRNYNLGEEVRPRGMDILALTNRPKNIKDFLNTESIEKGITVPTTSTTSTKESNPVDIGQATNALNLLNNLSTANSFETDLNPEFVDTPRFSYNDRTGFRRRQIQNAGRAALKGSQFTSQGQNSSFASNVLAQTLGAENQVISEERTREENSRNQFNQLLTRVDTINSQIGTNEDAGELSMRNRVRGARASAYDGFLRGVVGNLEQKEAQKMQGLQLDVLADIYGKRGRSVSKQLTKGRDLIR